MNGKSTAANTTLNNHMRRSLNKNKTYSDLINPKVDYGCYDSIIKEKLHSKLPKNQSFVKPNYIEEVKSDQQEKVPAWIQNK